MQVIQRFWQQRLAVIIVIAGFAAMCLGPAQADDGNRLLMIHSDHCPWCEAFDEEVGASYNKTAEGQLYPLEKIDFFETFPERYQILSPASFTPTFIIVKDNAEVGRIEGYPGLDLFWWRLSEFITPQS